MRLSPALALLAIAAASAAPAAAQTPPMPPAPTARFGLLVGANSATLQAQEDGRTLGDPSRRTALLIGGYGIVPLGQSAFALRPEILYSAKGGRQNFRPGDEDFDDFTQVRTNIDYLEVPLLFQLSPRLASGSFRPQFYAGPAVGFRARCRVEFQAADVTLSTNCREPDGDNDQLFRRVDVSAVAGGALAFDVAGRAVTVGARYTHGFSNILEFRGTDGDDAVRNRAISLYGSVEFPFGRPRR